MLDPGPRRCSAGNDPSICCLPGAWDRADVYLHGEPIDTEIITVAAERGIDPHRLDWHVEAIHGWESHDTGWPEAVVAAADCLAAGGCETEEASDA